MGNTDEWILDPEINEEADESFQHIQDTDAWCAKQLSQSHKKSLKSFENTIEIDLDDGTRLLCYHGSPQSHSDRIEATTTKSELDEFFEGIEAHVLAGAHTHSQLFRQYMDSIILNAGSIGLPQEQTQQGEMRNPSWAEWALLTTANGSINVELYRTSYDTGPLINAAYENEMPHVDYWSQGWKV